ncbi:MAG: hypothetical protein HY556_05145 [Euryarchaeota archaeon]|nr:hypothetical protein [Euryarchaeota archaeon]
MSITENVENQQPLDIQHISAKLLTNDGRQHVVSVWDRLDWDLRIAKNIGNQAALWSIHSERENPKTLPHGQIEVLGDGELYIVLRLQINGFRIRQFFYAPAKNRNTEPMKIWSIFSHRLWRRFQRCEGRR